MCKFFPLFCLLLLVVLKKSNCKSGSFAAKTINGSSAIDLSHSEIQFFPLRQQDVSSSTTRIPVVPSSSVHTSTSWPKNTTEDSTHLNRKPRSESTTRTTPLQPLSGYFKVVCYFTNFARYRKGAGRYSPGDVDPELCTHIVYGFAALDPEKLVINGNDFWADDDNGFQQRLTDFKSKGVKVSLSLGGWGDSGGDKYSKLVNNPAARARFIQNALEFLEMYNFDGLDLQWEFPKCWLGDCTKGPDSDKRGFAAWVTELKQAFAPKGYLLSAAVSAIKDVIDSAYDVPVLGANLDWISVRTYDFHGGWDGRTGHVAPLFYHTDDLVAYYNANFSINYWITLGAPRRKVIMGVPLYGRSFTLEKESVNGLNAKTTGLGQAGEFTVEAGLLGYYEICHNIKNKEWTVVRDPKKRIGPYAYKGNQWVSFDDQESVRIKSEFIRRMDLGGGMVWTLDFDDFKNRCGDGRHALLSTMRNALAEKGTGRSELFDPTLDTTNDGQPIVNRNSEFKVVCFFVNWAWYRYGVGKYGPSNIDPNLCTHIIYGFAILNSEKLTMGTNDAWADFDNRLYEEMTAYKSRGIKVLIGLGGWQDSGGDKYSRLVNDPSARQRFVSQAVNYIETNNFDGLTIEWIHPKCWLTDCSKGPASDKSGFANLVKELRVAFEPKGWILSAIVPHNRRAINAGYDIPVLSQNLDWLIVKCFDYHGPWDNVTGHVAPMYFHPDDGDAAFNTNSTIQYYLGKGADRKKLVLGMPMYGQSFTLAESDVNGLNAPVYGAGEAGAVTGTKGNLAYYEICSNVINKGWKVVKDENYRTGPYAYLKDQWVSFDDVSMIRHKSEYIKAMGLGGGMMWSLDMDDFKNICGCEQYPILKTINRVLRDYAKPDPNCILNCEDSVTQVVGKPKICKGSVIFEDRFNQFKINTGNWLIEEYIPFNDPNYEFVSYQNDRNVCFIRSKRILFIKPKAETEEKNVLDLRKSCTRVTYEECYTEKDTFIVPPVVSAKLVSKVKFRYGEIEIKAKLPAGDWIFPKIYLETQTSPGHTLWIAYARGNDRLMSRKGGEDLGNRLLLGGPVLDTGEPGRSKYLREKRFEQPVSKDFHVYKLRWTKGRIVLSVDGVPFGEVDEATMHNIRFAQTDTVHLVLGVGVGGINDFPDGVKSTNNEPKPWVNFSPHNRNQFFQARSKWLTTWRGDDSALQVDYVKITAL